MAKRGSGKVKGEILAEYEGLTISVSPQKAKRAGKDRLWIQIRIIQEGSDIGRKTKISAWYKCC